MSEKLKITNATQTEQMMIESKAAETTERHNVQMQTLPGDKDTSELVDYDKLASFLSKVTPHVLKALDEIYDSSAINQFETLALKDSTPQIQLLTRFLTNEESNLKRKISDICWSINGGLLAVSYSDLSHETWCNHLSEIRLYEFSGQDKLLETTNKSYETNSCVTCLSYHPSEPSILTAGLFNGDVVLWNFASGNSVTPVQVCTHGDTVSTLLWRPRTFDKPPLLITCSSDGYIFVHKSTNMNSTDMKLHRRYKIIKEHNPAENNRPRSAGGQIERAIEAGLSIVSIDFFFKNPEVYIVGTLCGGLYKCSMASVTPIKGDHSTIDPVIGTFDRCECSITCIKCSLTSNTTFVTSNTNKEIHIFDIHQTSPVRVITTEYTVTGLRWILSNHDVIAVYGANSFVKFLHIHTGCFHHLHIESAGINITCLDFSSKSREFSPPCPRDAVAISDTVGNLEVWKIPKQYNFII